KCCNGEDELTKIVRRTIFRTSYVAPFSDNQQEGRPKMFVKTIIAILVTLAAAWLTHSATATVATFLVAMIIVLLFEGIRIVPQQNAWVVERLGKFQGVLEPGVNLIVPCFARIAYKHS